MNKPCVLCGKELGLFSQSYRVDHKNRLLIDVKSEARVLLNELLPPSLPRYGFVCGDCWNSISRKITDAYNNTYQEQAKDVREERAADLEKRINEYKKYWDKNGVIQFKNERIAILHKTWGMQVQFIIAYDDLTRQGYRCVAQDEGRTAGGVGINSYYYFQKIEYIDNCKPKSGL